MDQKKRRQKNFLSMRVKRKKNSHEVFSGVLRRKKGGKKNRGGKMNPRKERKEAKEGANYFLTFHQTQKREGREEGGTLELSCQGRNGEDTPE